jgi:hypothetical protein
LEALNQPARSARRRRDVRFEGIAGFGADLDDAVFLGCP